MKLSVKQVVTALAVMGMVYTLGGCKKQPSKPSSNASGTSERPADATGGAKPNGEMRTGPRGPEIEKRAEKIAAREEQKQKLEAAKAFEDKVKALRTPKYTEAMVAESAKQAQASLDQVSAFVGDAQAAVVLTIKDPTTNEPAFVSANITGVEGDKFKGQVVRIEPKGAASQYAEKAEITIAKGEVVDWSCVKGTNLYGQFMMRAWLKDQSEHAAEEAVKAEARGQLERMGPALPEGAGGKPSPAPSAPTEPTAPK